MWNSVKGWAVLAGDTGGKQIIRGANSIGANIAEGWGRGPCPDNRRFVRTARGSLYETQHWLRRAYRRNLLTDKQAEALKPLVDSLSPMLNAYLRSISLTATKRSSLITKSQDPSTKN